MRWRAHSEIKSPMRVFLKHESSGFYYGGENSLVADAELAVDLRTVKHAIEVVGAQPQEWGAMEIVVASDKPGGKNLASMLPRRPAGQAAHGKGGARSAA